jgi:dihydrofolate synthase/folylpolyglutamate synthase
MVFMPHWPKMIGHKPIILGLERIEEMLAQLGNPHHNLPPVIHIAGTNGKGSTLAFLRAFLRAQGKTTHVYTSPHLLHFNERIVISDEQISDDALYELMEECRLRIDDSLQPTFFEATTAAAFLAFSRNKADYLLLETGLGGRLDATNVVEKPALTIITPISLDHMEYLGPTVELIAGEKTGILKKQTPCIVSAQVPSAFAMIEKQAEKLNVPLIACGYDWNVEETANGFLVRSIEDPQQENFPSPALPGPHQFLNAATAIMALRNLPGAVASENYIQEGLAKVRWMARLQKIEHGETRKLLSKNAEFFIDGAHNFSGMEALALTLERWEKIPTILLFGCTKGRDAKSLLKPLLAHITHLIAVKIHTEPSAIAPEKIATALQDLDLNISTAENIEDAILAANNLMKNHTGRWRLLSAGSLYLASDILRA